MPEGLAKLAPQPCSLGNWHRDPDGRVAVRDLCFVQTAERQIDAPGAISPRPSSSTTTYHRGVEAIVELRCL